jgi:hypothetical protein
MSISPFLVRNLTSIWDALLLALRSLIVNLIRNEINLHPVTETAVPLCNSTEFSFPLNVLSAARAASRGLFFFFNLQQLLFPIPETLLHQRSFLLTAFPVNAKQKLFIFCFQLKLSS